jgi:transcriptional regulatory protein RtcR
MSSKTVVFSFLDTTLDVGGADNRWPHWRPTVALFQYEDFLIDRLELIHADQDAALAWKICQDIAQASPETNVVMRIMNFKDARDFGSVYATMFDFAQGYAFDPESEAYFVNITTGTHLTRIGWLLLTEARYIPGKLVQLSPPKRESSGSIGSYDIIDLDLSRYDAIVTRFNAERVEATSFLKSGIATRNLAFNRLIDEIEKVAVRSRAPVLITGPTGAGKSQLARRIYELKKARRQIERDFVEVNCATLRGDQAMSALFGHVKGAFAGAQTERAGLLKTAHQGLLFLDEIGELGQDEQAMILRAIEEKRFLPVGADKEATSDFQLIAGTNRDLTAAVGAGAFREDLLARLNLWTFDLPGLRDRREDIEPNIAFELKRFAERERRSITFNKEARERYIVFANSPQASWDANFRDLSASMTRMATLAPNGRINEETVIQEIKRLARFWSKAKSDPEIQGLLKLLGEERLEALDLFDRAQLATVMKTCQRSASLSAAGRALFQFSRLTKTTGNDADRLRKYLARFDLTFEKLK